MNRLSMKAWAAFVAVVSLGLLLLGASGIYMWFTRRPERRIGLALLAVNLIFAVTVLALHANRVGTVASGAGLKPCATVS